MKKINQKGFSIIEVLIVLAIAGLIMLVVFLAVPALQRNARNNGRQSDASKFAAAVNQCLSNNNGNNANCRNVVTSGNGVIWDSAEAGQLEIAAYSSTAAGTAPVPQAANAGATPPITSTNNMVYKFGYKCTGATATAGTSREFAIVYNTEGTGSNTQPACISS